MPPSGTKTTVVLVCGGVEVASWPFSPGGRHDGTGLDGAGPHLAGPDLAAPDLAGPDLAGPDLAVIAELARLQLAARRLGCSIVLLHAGGRLLELLELAGLEQVVPAAPDLVVEVGGEPEGGEQAGVEEVVVTDDPVA